MYMRPYGPGLISAINRFWPKLSLTGVLQPGDEVIICVQFVQYSCFWHAGLLHGKKWSGFLALSKIWIIEIKNFVCICVMILLHHFCQKNFWPKFSLTGVLHPGDGMVLLLLYSWAHAVSVLTSILKQPILSLPPLPTLSLTTVTLSNTVFPSLK